MKREPGMSGWYCAHGLPRGFEASVLRARGLAPLPPTPTYTRMLELAGYKAETGHDERGDLWLWAPAPLARLIPCGAEIRYRVFMCAHLGAIDPATRAWWFDDLEGAVSMPARERLLVELDASVRLAGYTEQGFRAVLGRIPTVEELRSVFVKIFPPDGRRGDVYRRHQ